MLQVCLQMFFSEGLNRSLGFCAQAKERHWWQECCSGFLSIQSCSHSKAWLPADVQGPPQSHFVFSHPRKFTNLTKNTKSHLKGKCSVPQHDTTEFRLFAKWQTPKKEAASNLWTICLEACTWACWWEGRSMPDTGVFSSPQNTAEIRSSHFCSWKPKSEVTRTKKDNASFTPRTATSITWSHSKYHNIL